MNTLVLLRPLRDPASFTVNRKAQKIFVHREQSSVNPSDKSALEAALRLGGHVTAVAFGGAPAEDSLRLARALGAHRAVHIKAPAPADAGVVVALLQNALEQLGPMDLILLGAEVLDADQAQVGARLAQALGWPLLSEAHQVSVADSSGAAIVWHRGAFHRAETNLPAVITVARDSHQLRYAHGRDIMHFYKEADAVEVMEVGEFSASVEVRGESYPPERELGVQLSGTLPELARQVAEIVRKS